MPYTGAIYNSPIDGNQSSIGNQLRTDFYQKKALIEAKKLKFFSQLADTISMPKHMGKTIKRFHYLPLLDDANINDQGIDANSVGSDDNHVETSIVVTMLNGDVPPIPPYFGRASDNKVYFTGSGANAAAAEDAAKDACWNWVTASTESGGLGLALTKAVSLDADCATFMTTGGASAFDKNFRFANTAGTVINGTATELESTAVNHYGNIYGSSKDIGTITDKLPALSESGGRVNRVGFKRVELEGNLEKFGFFTEYTQESLDFDSDSELQMHINREMINGAHEMTEDALQIDLINHAGMVRYPGAATSVTELDGAAALIDVGSGSADWSPSEVSYGSLQKLSVDLDNNRCPKQTKIITGTRMIDTKVINSARIMYCGSEMQETFERMVDYHGNQAFIPLAKYAAAGSEINGEIGSVGHFRIVVVPEMLHKAGVGATEGANKGYRVTNGKYDAYPLLVVGSESFTTIGFETSGKGVKFKIKHVPPSQNYSSDDPYGETGFMSIKWYYGFMALRPERIALIWSVARW